MSAGSWLAAIFPRLRGKWPAKRVEGGYWTAGTACPLRPSGTSPAGGGGSKRSGVGGLS